jgi:hypothetical protein
LGLLNDKLTILRECRLHRPGLMPHHHDDLGQAKRLQVSRG